MVDAEGSEMRFTFHLACAGAEIMIGANFGHKL